MLREDPGIALIGEGLDESALGWALGLTDAVVLLDEAAVPSLPLRLRASRRDLPVVVLACSPTPVYGLTLLAFGISCLDWEVSSTDLSAAVRRTYLGRTVFLAGECHMEHDPGAEAPFLTERELAILILLSQRESYGAIALLLGISTSTVRAHTARLREKLNAKSRRELSDLPVLASPLLAPRAAR